LAGIPTGDEDEACSSEQLLICCGDDVELHLLLGSTSSCCASAGRFMYIAGSSEKIGKRTSMILNFPANSLALPKGILRKKSEFLLSFGFFCFVYLPNAFQVHRAYFNDNTTFFVL
jgi:hypothetical protein